ASVFQRRPRTSTSPLSATVSPSQISIVVVLPAPLGPSRPKHSPDCTSRSIESTAMTFAYDLRSERRARAEGIRTEARGITKVATWGMDGGTLLAPPPHPRESAAPVTPPLG